MNVIATALVGLSVRSNTVSVRPNSLHVVFTSECNNPQFDWFSLGVFRSFRNSGIDGKITRLLACDSDELVHYRGMHIGPTFVHPNYRNIPHGNDYSPTYNKPASIYHFARDSGFMEEFVLFIDADMLLMKDIDVESLGARRGVVVSERVDYMIGTSNDMAKQFLWKSEIPYAKPVGWYHIIHRDDLLTVARNWLHFCGEVRSNPQKYWSINGSLPHNISTGDNYVKYGEAPWISEMYGYSFGAARSKVEHVVTHGMVVYPYQMDETDPAPHIIHYGIDFNINTDYNFNKMNFKKLDVTTCPNRFFESPPVPKTAAGFWGARAVHILNDALCDYYFTWCPGETVCPPLYQGPPDPDCTDNDKNCWSWAMNDQCAQNPKFMLNECKRSCRQCKIHESDQSVARQEHERLLRKYVHDVLPRMTLPPSRVVFGLDIRIRASFAVVSVVSVVVLGFAILVTRCWSNRKELLTMLSRGKIPHTVRRTQSLGSVPRKEV